MLVYVIYFQEGYAIAKFGKFVNKLPYYLGSYPIGFLTTLIEMAAYLSYSSKYYCHIHDTSMTLIAVCTLLRAIHDLFLSQ